MIRASAVPGGPKIDKDGPSRHDRLRAQLPLTETTRNRFGRAV